jgi:hypothetical protein
MCVWVRARGCACVCVCVRLYAQAIIRTQSTHPACKYPYAFLSLSSACPLFRLSESLIPKLIRTRYSDYPYPYSKVYPYPLFWLSVPAPLFGLSVPRFIPVIRTGSTARVTEYSPVPTCGSASSCGRQRTSRGSTCAAHRPAAVGCPHAAAAAAATVVAAAAAAPQRQRQRACCYSAAHAAATRPSGSALL